MLRSRLGEKPHLFVALCVVAFVIVGIATLPKYGLTWDEGLADLFFGQRYFHFFVSFDPTYLDFNRGDLAIHQRSLNLVGGTEFIG